ncbi:hypothetical protein ACN47E_007644 [Coniothyrium glycines]
MADEANVPVVADATKDIEEATRLAEADATPVVAETKLAEGGVAATSGVTEVPATNSTGNATGTGENGASNVDEETKPTNGDADVASAADAPDPTDTPAGKATANGKRKSGAGISEHNKKKTPAKKKSTAKKLVLDATPGAMYMVAMRGYQPWPVIICDEEMLPESLLSKRPVSAKRIDGTYREDFEEGGKNAKDRRYPVMFLSTNEFAWQVNTDLLEFDFEQVKKDVEEDNQKGKKKALWEAYKVAAEGHDLQYFKDLLVSHELAMQDDADQREEKEIQKKEKAEKAAKRKSIAAAEESEDVEMEDAGDNTAPSTKKAKPSKKRKKDDESDGENEKTPKTKLKLTTKTPKDASAAKPKKEPKSKKKASEEAEPAPEEPPLTKEEELQKREKQVLYLRHRLQKGFLSRDQAPKDEDMKSMSEYLTQLESIENLEAEIIKKTKVNKVLKAIIKLGAIPREEEFDFKGRSSILLGKWNNILAADGGETNGATTSAEPTTNGVKHEEEEKKSEADKEDSSAEKTENDEQKDDTPAAPATAASANEEGDVAMSEANKEVIEDAPVAQADAEASTEAATGADAKTVESDHAAAGSVTA